MFNYHKVTLQDEQWANSILRKSERFSCEFSFVNIFMWGTVYHTLISQDDGILIARSTSPENPETSPYSYLFPVGNGDKKLAIEKMIMEANQDGRDIQIYSVSTQDKTWLETQFEGLFEFEYSRDECDYVYQSEVLQTLKGKKMQKKRNHVARFLKEYPDYTVETITEDNLQQVITFNNVWANLNDNNEDKGIAKEHDAVDLILENYFSLNLQGCMIKIDDNIVAFSYGSELNSQTFCTHVEKALYDINGAYNMINRQVALSFCQDYQYINREDDVGSEGLRTAKLSYKPDFLVEKYIATLKGKNTPTFL